MSGKGDKRRPGTGYADNWDRIFGKNGYQIEIAGDSVFGLDPSKTYRTEVAKDGSVSYWETNAPEGQQHTGWPPGMLQDDSYPLAHALSSKPDARQHVRDVAAVATDAARYRWLRRGLRYNMVVPSPTEKNPKAKITIFVAPNPQPEYAACLDAVIDAAIKQSEITGFGRIAGTYGVVKEWPILNEDDAPSHGGKP